MDIGEGFGIWENLLVGDGEIFATDDDDDDDGDDDIADAAGGVGIFRGRGSIGSKFEEFGVVEVARNESKVFCRFDNACASSTSITALVSALLPLTSFATLVLLLSLSAISNDSIARAWGGSTLIGKFTVFEEDCFFAFGTTAAAAAAETSRWIDVDVDVDVDDLIDCWATVVDGEVDLTLEGEGDVANAGRMDAVKAWSVITIEGEGALLLVTGGLWWWIDSDDEPVPWNPKGEVVVDAGCGEFRGGDFSVSDEEDDPNSILSSIPTPILRFLGSFATNVANFSADAFFGGETGLGSEFWLGVNLGSTRAAPSTSDVFDPLCWNNLTSFSRDFNCCSETCARLALELSAQAHIARSLLGLGFAE
jgi:hypothetical protein